LPSDFENTPLLEDLPPEQPSAGQPPDAGQEAPSPASPSPVRTPRKKSFFAALERKQVLALLGALAVFDLAFWVFVVLPLADQEQRQVERIAELSRQIAQKTEDLETLRTVRDRIGVARTQGDELVAEITFDRRTTFSQLLADMDEAAVESGIEIRERLYDQQPIEGADHYGMLTITSNYRGQYDKLVKFLNQLDRSERFLIIESLGATPRAESNDLQFTLKIDTFVREL
jgi:Tfp pilus assembly protein PilO